MFGMSMKNVGQQIDAPVAVSNIRGVDSVVSLSKPESVATEISMQGSSCTNKTFVVSRSEDQPAPHVRSCELAETARDRAIQRARTDHPFSRSLSY